MSEAFSIRHRAIHFKDNFTFLERVIEAGSGSPLRSPRQIRLNQKLKERLSPMKLASCTKVSDPCGPLFMNLNEWIKHAMEMKNLSFHKGFEKVHLYLKFFELIIQEVLPHDAFRQASRDIESYLTYLSQDDTSSLQDQQDLSISLCLSPRRHEKLPASSPSKPSQAIEALLSPRTLSLKKKISTRKALDAKKTVKPKKIIEMPDHEVTVLEIASFFYDTANRLLWKNPKSLRHHPHHSEQLHHGSDGTITASSIEDLYNEQEKMKHLRKIKRKLATRDFFKSLWKNLPPRPQVDTFGSLQQQQDSSDHHPHQSHHHQQQNDHHFHGIGHYDADGDYSCPLTKPLREDGSIEMASYFNLLLLCLTNVNRVGVGLFSMDLCQLIEKLIVDTMQLMDFFFEQLIVEKKNKNQNLIVLKKEKKHFEKQIEKLEQEIASLQQKSMMSLQALLIEKKEMIQLIEEEKWHGFCKALILESIKQLEQDCCQVKILFLQPETNKYQELTPLGINAMLHPRGRFQLVYMTHLIVLSRCYLHLKAVKETYDSSSSTNTGSTITKQHHSLGEEEIPAAALMKKISMSELIALRDINDVMRAIEALYQTTGAKSTVERIQASGIVNRKQKRTNSTQTIQSKQQPQAITHIHTRHGSDSDPFPQVDQKKEEEEEKRSNIVLLQLPQDLKRLPLHLRELLNWLTLPMDQGSEKSKDVDDEGHSQLVPPPPSSSSSSSSSSSVAITREMSMYSRDQLVIIVNAVYVYIEEETQVSQGNSSSRMSQEKFLELLYSFFLLKYEEDSLEEAEMQLVHFLLSIDQLLEDQQKVLIRSSSGHSVHGGLASDAVYLFGWLVGSAATLTSMNRPSSHVFTALFYVHQVLHSVALSRRISHHYHLKTSSLVILSTSTGPESRNGAILRALTDGHVYSPNDVSNLHEAASYHEKKASPHEQKDRTHVLLEDAKLLLHYLFYGIVGTFTTTTATVSSRANQKITMVKSPLAIPEVKQKYEEILQDRSTTVKVLSSSKASSTGCYSPPKQQDHHQYDNVPQEAEIKPTDHQAILPIETAISIALVAWMEVLATYCDHLETGFEASCLVDPQGRLSFTEFECIMNTLSTVSVPMSTLGRIFTQAHLQTKQASGMDSVTTMKEQQPQEAIVVPWRTLLGQVIDEFDLLGISIKQNLCQTMRGIYYFMDKVKSLTSFSSAYSTYNACSSLTIPWTIGTSNTTMTASSSCNMKAAQVTFCLRLLKETNTWTSLRTTWENNIRKLMMDHLLLVQQSENPLEVQLNSINKSTLRRRIQQVDIFLAEAAEKESDYQEDTPINPKLEIAWRALHLAQMDHGRFTGPIAEQISKEKNPTTKTSCPNKQPK